jgi:hypothetical protein
VASRGSCFGLSILEKMKGKADRSFSAIFGLPTTSITTCAPFHLHFTPSVTHLATAPTPNRTQVRRQFRSYTSSLFNLSDSERSMMSLPFEDPVRKSGSVRTIGTTAESIIKNNNNNQNNPVTGTGDVNVDAIGKTGLLDKHGKGIAGPMNGESTIRGRFV